MERSIPPNEHANARSLPARGWPRLRTLLGRALMRRCPLCGTGGIFKNWWSLRDACPRCGHRFEREEGYFLGAYAVNLIAAEFLTVAVLVALFVWTDVSWVAIEAIVIPLAVGLPILFFPYSRTLWMAIDLMADPAVNERQLRRAQTAERARDATGRRK
jgi:uncharacterized protein (DUF983 family)